MPQLLVRNIEGDAINQASSAYFEYCQGLTIARLTGEFVRPSQLEPPEEVITVTKHIVEAHHVMLSGCRNFIKAAAGVRKTEALPHLEFESTAANMRRLLTASIERRHKHLGYLSSLYEIVRPAPFLQPKVFNKIVSNHTERITTEELMDFFWLPEQDD